MHKTTLSTAIIVMLCFFPYHASGLDMGQQDPLSAMTMETIQLSSPAVPSKGEFGRFSIIPSSINSIEPSTILIEMKPGGLYEDAVILENKSDYDIFVHMYASDGYISQEGDHNAKNELAPQTFIGQWTTIEESEHNLAPHEKKEIRFFIQVPKHISTGTTFRGWICAVIPVPDTVQGMVKYSLRYVTPIKISITDNPSNIPRLGETNIFENGTPYFWGSIGIFVLGIAYLIFGTIRDKKKRISKLKT